MLRQMMRSRDALGVGSPGGAALLLGPEGALEVIRKG